MSQENPNPYEGMIFYLQTIKTSIFKQLIEALKDMLQDVNVSCTTNGLKIISLDVTKTIVVRLKLNDRIGEYYCKSDCNLGVDMGLFNTIIKTLNNTDVLTLCVHEKDRDNLIIKIENKDKQRDSLYHMRLFDVKDEIIQACENFTSLSIKNGKFYYDYNNLILDDINLEINRGEL